MALWHRGTWEGCPHEIRTTRVMGSQTTNWCTCMVHSQSTKAQEHLCPCGPLCTHLSAGRALHEAGTTGHSVTVW